MYVFNFVQHRGDVRGKGLGDKKQTGAEWGVSDRFQVNQSEKIPMPFIFPSVHVPRNEAFAIFVSPV